MSPYNLANDFGAADLTSGGKLLSEKLYDLRSTAQIKL